MIGHDGHEEVEGTTGEAPESIILVETTEDVDRLEIEDPDKVAFITQTTLSVDETAGVIARLRERFPNIASPKSDDICYATTNRQLAVKQLAAECDLVLVIGSRNSSNSNRLVDVTRELGTPSLPDRQGDRGPRGVARGRRDARHHLRRQRPRGARHRARRHVPRPRHRRRLRAPGDRRGRPLHAPEADPGRSRRRRPPAEPAQRSGPGANASDQTLTVAVEVEPDLVHPVLGMAAELVEAGAVEDDRAGRLAVDGQVDGAGRRRAPPRRRRPRTRPRAARPAAPGSQGTSCEPPGKTSSLGLPIRGGSPVGGGPRTGSGSSWPSPPASSARTASSVSW